MGGWNRMLYWECCWSIFTPFSSFLCFNFRFW